MKRTVYMIMVIFTMFMAFSIDAKAGVRDDIIKEKFESSLYDDWTESYKMFREQKANGEIHLVKDLAVTYSEVGINVYDVCMYVVLEDEERFEYHTFYDAVEDEWFSEYFQFGEERMSYEEFEELYPELLKEIN